MRKTFFSVAKATVILIVTAISFLSGYTLGFIQGHDEGMQVGPTGAEIAKDLPFLHRKIDPDFPARDF